ncbi:7-cyano-7-deazaguanine synthase [Dirofilaria immitis]
MSLAGAIFSKGVFHRVRVVYVGCAGADGLVEEGSGVGIIILFIVRSTGYFCHKNTYCTTDQIGVLSIENHIAFTSYSGIVNRINRERFLS